MFSVTLETRLAPVPGREVGRGSVEGVPGTPLAEAGPELSSVLWEFNITERAGSKISSLCSPPVKSHSTEAPARNLPAPSNGSSVAPILATRSASTLCR